MSLLSNFQDLANSVRLALTKKAGKKDVDKLSKNVSKIDTKVGMLNNSVDGINSEITDINRDVAQNRNDINNLREKVEIGFYITENVSSPTGYTISFSDPYNQNFYTVYNQILFYNKNVYLRCDTYGTINGKNFQNKLFTLENMYKTYSEFGATFILQEDGYKSLIVLPVTYTWDLQSTTTSDYFYIKNNFSGSYNDLTDKPELATVATTGSYNDLIDVPDNLATTTYVDDAVADAKDVSVGNTQPSGDECVWYKYDESMYRKMIDYNLGESILINTRYDGTHYADLPWVVVNKNTDVSYVELMSVFCLFENFTSTELRYISVASAVQTKTINALPVYVRNVVQAYIHLNAFTFNDYKDAFNTWISNQDAETQARYGSDVNRYRLSGIDVTQFNNYWVDYQYSTNKGTYFDSTGALKSNQTISNFNAIFARPSVIRISGDTYDYILKNSSSPEYANIESKIKVLNNWVTFNNNNKVLLKYSDLTPSTAYQTIQNLILNSKIPQLLYNGNIYEYSYSLSYGQYQFVRLSTGSSVECVNILHTSPYINIITVNIPSQGNISSGNTGYVTGGDVYNAIQNIDLSGKENVSNKVTSLSSSSTNTQYPSAKAVYDALPNIPDGTNSGDILVWNGSAWVAQQPSELPVWYQKVEYIEGTGTQYLLLDYSASGDMHFVLEAESDSWLGSGQGVFGARDSADKKMYELLALSSNMRLDFGTGTDEYYYYHFTALGGKRKFDLNKNVFSVDDIEKKTFASGTFTGTYRMCIFSSNQGGTPNNKFAMKVYGANAFRNDAPISRLIPCYRKSDNEIGMYDVIAEKFYTNAGTGSFTCYPAPPTP